MGEKTRLWCFTNFNLDFDYDDYLSRTTAQYVIVGREICPKTKRPHDQGFVYFSGARSSVKQVSHQLGKVWCKKCDGNLDQNCDYCVKDDKVREFGVKPKQGFRTDLEAIKDTIMNGSMSVDDICVENPNLYHQYGRTLSKLEDIALRKKYRSWMTKGYWYYGPTGVGKSHRAFEGFSPDTHYVMPNDGGWCDGYVGQETIIINEFRGNIAYAELLDLIDWTPKTLRRRGREPVPLLAKKIIITSSLHPREVYNNLSINDSLEQLMRRIELVKMEQKWLEGNNGPLTNSQSVN